MRTHPHPSLAKEVRWLLTPPLLTMVDVSVLSAAREAAAACPLGPPLVAGNKLAFFAQKQKV
ncbi:MAG: hypothetical protein ACR2H5_03720 [Ktedonobacteraceae bacterium]